jgi:hypothetical protein
MGRAQTNADTRLLLAICDAGVNIALPAWHDKVGRQLSNQPIYRSGDILPGGQALDGEQPAGFFCQTFPGYLQVCNIV